MKQDTEADSPPPKSGMRDHANFIWRFILFALPFWSAEHKWMNRGRLALIAALTVAQVAVQVGLNSWSARLYNAVEARQLEVRRQGAVAEDRTADAGAERQHDLQPLPLDDPQSLDLGVIEQAGRFA